MKSWTPATMAEVEGIVNSQLSQCSEAEKEAFENFRVPFHTVPLMRNGGREDVFVVARREDEVMYYEDVEGGFNISAVGDRGLIRGETGNQDEIRFAIQKWM